jgi:hypothetical protein
MKHVRKHWTSKLYKQVKVGEDSVFIPLVDDLDDFQLVWHYDRARDEEDYEYMSVLYTEAESRGIKHCLIN